MDVSKAKKSDLKIFLLGSVKNRALVVKTDGRIDSIIPRRNKLTLKQTP